MSLSSLMTGKNNIGVGIDSLKNLKIMNLMWYRNWQFTEYTDGNAAIGYK